MLLFIPRNFIFRQIKLRVKGSIKKGEINEKNMLCIRDAFNTIRRDYSSRPTVAFGSDCSIRCLFSLRHDIWHLCGAHYCLGPLGFLYLLRIILSQNISVNNAVKDESQAHKVLSNIFHIDKEDDNKYLEA